jgi:hypothetical protein
MAELDFAEGDRRQVKGWSVKNLLIIIASGLRRLLCVTPVTFK